MNLVEIARLFLFVREVGKPNSGLWVNIFQRFVGIDDGQSWCAAFVCFVLAIWYEGRNELPFTATGVCQDIYRWAKKYAWIITAPRPGDLYLYVNSADHAHHVGIVTGAGQGIAGNTSADGKSDNGTGVFEHALPESGVVFVRLPGR